nr:hypothetical protein [uncultured Flavobacterium sp.]
MIDKEILIKRLSIIKLLYKTGLEQSKQSESISFFSILTFHDSIEMFLKLASEHKGIKSDKFSFIVYWNHLPLTLKESMNNLNSRRVNLKHRGLLPAKIEIETSRVNASDFFEQNTLSIFGLNFSEISLFELIKFKKTKNLLISAQKRLISNEIENCIFDVAVSFQELLSEYKENKFDYRKRTLFNFSKSIRLDRNSKNNEGQLVDIVKQMNDKFSEIENTLEVISLGIDFRKYSKFTMITPELYKEISTGNYVIHNQKYFEEIRSEDCQFLIDFVLDCSLKLQEFDYENPNFKLS